MRKKNVNFPNHQPGLNIHFFQLWVLCKVTCGFIPQGKLGKLLELNTFKDSTRKYLECFTRYNTRQNKQSGNGGSLEIISTMPLWMTKY